MTMPLSAVPHASGVGGVLQIFRDGRPRTKAEIASITGLSRSTVALRVDALIASGLVIPGGEAVSSGGRPPATLVFNPAARLVIALDLAVTHGVTAVCDLAGTVLAHELTDLQITDGPIPVLDQAIAAAKRLLAGLGRDWDSVAGVGVGVPGPVEHDTGRPFNPPIMPGWDRFDIPGHVGAALGVPVFVDNDVNVLAIGERAAAWSDTGDLIYVKVSTGVGAGIISGGVLQRGAQGAAGDIGQVRVPGAALGAAALPGLEDLAGGRALAAQLTTEAEPIADAAGVVRKIRDTDAHTQAVLRQAGRDIGEVLAMYVSMLNPSVIILGGSIGEAGQDLLAGVREVVYQRSIALATAHLSIVLAQAGELGGAIGAARLVVENVLDPVRVDQLLS